MTPDETAAPAPEPFGERGEHLAWAKARALQYLDAGDATSAVASMTSDLRKHKDWQNPASEVLFQMGVMELMAGGARVRRWIEGFN
jgi:hypothetical protein